MPAPLYVFNGACVRACTEENWGPNDAGTACVALPAYDLDLFLIPVFVLSAAVGWLIALVGACRKRPGRTKYISTQNTLTCLVIATAPPQLACCAACAVLGWVRGSVIFAAVFAGVWLIAFITNCIFAAMYWGVFRSRVIPADKAQKYKEKKITKA